MLLIDPSFGILWGKTIPISWFKYEIDGPVISFTPSGETGNIALRGKFHGAFRHQSAEKDV
jgi:hypothetical protein